jgi:hypothetical protein
MQKSNSSFEYRLSYFTIFFIFNVSWSVQNTRLSKTTSLIKCQANWLMTAAYQKKNNETNVYLVIFFEPLTLLIWVVNRKTIKLFFALQTLICAPTCINNKLDMKARPGHHIAIPPLHDVLYMCIRQGRELAFWCMFSSAR